MDDLIVKVRALAGAVSARLAALQSLLTVLAVEVVPLLPDNVAVQAAAWVAVGLGWVATAIALVSRVTPVPVAARGLTMPENRVLQVEVVNGASRVVAERTVTPPR